MFMLIIARLIQGLGAGAVMPIATTIVGDIYGDFSLRWGWHTMGLAVHDCSLVAYLYFCIMKNM